MIRCKFLDADAYKKAEAARIELAKSRSADPAWMAANKATYGWARLDEIVGCCVMWFAPWYHDPNDPEDVAKIESSLASIRAGEQTHLSRFYYETWARTRPPIVAICPDGSHWCVDAKSSNGEGWKVTGEPPNISCAPSIAVKGYHGFLQNGMFTGDLDKR